MSADSIVFGAVKDLESSLYEQASRAISDSSWAVGEAAAVWVRKCARGRSDSDFADAIGITSTQVHQRRRVWEAFSDVRADYPNLLWSNFYAALGWDDAFECLKWANDVKANAAEMRAWRRAQRGEDLTEE